MKKFGASYTYISLNLLNGVQSTMDSFNLNDIPNFS